MGANKKARSQQRKLRTVVPDFVVDGLTDNKIDWTMDFHEDDKLDKLLSDFHEGRVFTIFPQRLKKLMPNLATDLISKRLDVQAATMGILKRYSEKYNRDFTPTEADYLRQQFAHKALEFVPNYRDLIAKSDLESFQQSMTEPPQQGRQKSFYNVPFYVNETLRKWQGFMDVKLCAGVRGKFLDNCPIYGLPENELRKMSSLMRSEYIVGATKQEFLEAYVSMSAYGLMYGVIGVKAACWECHKLLAGDNSFTCSCCKTANYCGTICQQRAWYDGHNKKCPSLHAKYNQLQKSFQAVDELPGDVYAKVKAYSLIHSMTHSSGESFMRHFSHLDGPNINIFYANMKRMKTGRSIFDDRATSMRSYNSQFKDEIQKEDSEMVMFVEAIFVLSFDFVKHAKMRQKQGREIQHFTSRYASVLTKMVGMELASRRMPTQRFLVLYDIMENEWESIILRDPSQWKKTQRVLTNYCLLTFRAMHHKNRTSNSPRPSVILNRVYSEEML